MSKEKKKEICSMNKNSTIKYPESEVETLSIATEYKKFLKLKGLPGDAAPFLSFGSTPRGTWLIAVSEHWGLPKSFSRYRIIGTTGTGDPICIDELENGVVVYLNHDRNFEKVIMNSSVLHLSESLLVYRCFVEKTIRENGPDAYLNDDIPEHLKKWINAELKRIDKSAMDEGCFWPSYTR